MQSLHWTVENWKIHFTQNKCCVIILTRIYIYFKWLVVRDGGCESDSISITCIITAMSCLQLIIRFIWYCLIEIYPVFQLEENVMCIYLTCMCFHTKATHQKVTFLRNNVIPFFCHFCLKGVHSWSPYSLIHSLITDRLWLYPWFPTTLMQSFSFQRASVMPEMCQAMERFCSVRVLNPHNGLGSISSFQMFSWGSHLPVCPQFDI